MGFQLAALAILLLFYGIYFTKQLAQKRRGIQTRQMGRRKEKDLHRVEVLMAAATGLIVPVQLLSIGFQWGCLPGGVRALGAVLGLVGDGIFLVAVLTMWDSWRAGIPETDRTDFVSTGIYRYSRNPAFLGFDLMYLGILLLFFNLPLLLFTLWAMVMLHLQILQEERYLPTVFGTAYATYQKQVCRYLGRRRS